MLSYSIGGAAYLVLALLLLVSWRGRLEGGVLLLAIVIQILWSVVIVYDSYALVDLGYLILLLELFRLAAWNAFIHKLIRPSENRKLYRFLGFSLYLVVVIGGSYIALLYYFTDGFLSDTTKRLFVFVYLALSILGLVLTEQLYRNIKIEKRWAIKFLCIALAILFGYDIYMYSETMLMGKVGASIWIARGVIGVFIVPLIALSAARNPKWSFDIFVSRQIVFYTSGILAISAYLLLMSLTGYYIRIYGGQWGDVAQIIFLTGMVIVLFVVSASGKTRSRIKIFLTKHFYKNKYDYREEWMRLIHNLSEYKTPKYFREHIIQTIAGLIQSRGGLLYIDEDDEYQCVAEWNAVTPVQAISAESSLSIFANKHEWIIDVNEYMTNREIYDKLELPGWLLEVPGIWLVVPLKHYYKLIGFILLLESPTLKTINWEDRDLLKATARQISSYLAFGRASEALNEAQQFNAFNRLSAYLVHDLKNLVSQLELTVKNSEKYRDNPEFVADAMQTVNNVAGRIQKMLGQLKKVEFEVDAVENRQVDVARLLEDAVNNRSSQQPGPLLRVKSDVHIKVDPDRFLSGIEHIIQNAQEACVPDGDVIVELSSEDHFAVIKITDNGCGMDKLFISERLFKPFDTTKGNAGMGIGVFEVKEFVKHMGGKIEVNSKPGVGTSFIIKLPRIDG